MSDSDYYYSSPLVLRDLMVFDPPDVTVISGILDQHGNPIKYHLAGMDPIGFIHFNNDEDESDSKDAE